MVDEVAGGEEESPRRFLVDPSRYGHDPAAPWRPLSPGDDHAEVIAAYWQHLALCTLREKSPVRLVDVVAERLGKANVVYLRRQVSGEYRVRFEELIRWVIAFDDITLLPQVGKLADLYPPGAFAGTGTAGPALEEQ